MKWSNKNVLVTGGAGFIGSRVVDLLVKKGANVRVVDDLSKGEATNLRENIKKIEFIQADLTKKKAAKNSLKDMDFCFNFAARIGGIGYFHKHPATILRDNTLISLNLWEAARDTNTKMICVSSSMVFERAKMFPTPEEAVKFSPPPLTGYGFSKLVAEYIAKTYYEEFNIPYVIVRPFNVYGPGEMPGNYIGYSHVIPDLVKKIISGQYPLEILGNGKQTRSYTYVDDAAAGIIFAAEYGENDDFNIGTGIETSVVELANILWKICGRKEPIKFKFLQPFKYDVQRRVPDVSKIKKLGWKPNVPLEKGLKITVEWLKKRMKEQERKPL